MEIIIWCHCNIRRSWMCRDDEICWTKWKKNSIWIRDYKYTSYEKRKNYASFYNLLVVFFFHYYWLISTSAKNLLLGEKITLEMKSHFQGLWNRSFKILMMTRANLFWQINLMHKIGLYSWNGMKNTIRILIMHSNYTLDLFIR